MRKDEHKARRQRRRQSTLHAVTTLVVYTLCLNDVSGFISPINTSGMSHVSPSVGNHPAATQLRAFRGKKDTKKGSNTPRRGSKSKPTSKKQRTPKTKTGKPNGSGQKKSTPPWQVLSTKNMEKNVEKEKERRKLVKQGIRERDIVLNNINDSTKVLSTNFLSDAEQRLLNWKRFNPDKAAGMKFIGAFLNKQLPPRMGVPEVAFLGRSNVGKSSLLNRLSSVAARNARSDHARVGKTPGATASVNLYTLVDAKDRELLGWADLPGFGYAKLSKEVKESVQEAAENYLGKRQELMLGILLVDIRRTPSDDDRGILAALYDMGVPIVVVATKVDKVSVNEKDRSLAEIRDGLGLPNGQPFCVSSVTGEGCRELWQILLEGCETGVEEFKSKYDEELAFRMRDEKEDAVEFNDSEDYVYDQGYDWIHGNVVDYNDEETFEDKDREHIEDMKEDYDDLLSDTELDNSSRRETLKSLKARARDMERRGEL